MGIVDSALPIAVHTTLLEGGTAGAFTSSIETLREYSTRPLYNPVPYDFLNIASDTPVLNLKVNQIPALCPDCSFQYDAAKTITIDSATLSD